MRHQMSTAKRITLDSKDAYTTIHYANNMYKRFTFHTKRNVWMIFKYLFGQSDYCDALAALAHFIFESNYLNFM